MTPKAESNVRPIRRRKEKFESAYFVVRVPVTSREMVMMYGDEPEVLDVGCPACDSWRMWGRTGCVEVEIHREKFLSAFLDCKI